MCNNTKGSYNCSCKPGYSVDGRICRGIEANISSFLNGVIYVIYIGRVSNESTSNLINKFYFQILMSAHEKNTTAVAMQCVTIPRDRTTAHANLGILEMAGHAQVEFCTECFSTNVRRPIPLFVKSRMFS